MALAHPTVAREISKAKLPYNVNLVTLAAAEVALAHHDRITERVRQVVAARERLCEALGALPGLVVYPSAANFLMVRCEAVPARTVFLRLQEEFGILVRDISGGVDLEECLRITVGRDDDVAAVIAAFTWIFGGTA